jgi:hypothetical protein
MIAPPDSEMISPPEVRALLALIVVISYASCVKLLRLFSPQAFTRQIDAMSIVNEAVQDARHSRATIARTVRRTLA